MKLMGTEYTEETPLFVVLAQIQERARYIATRMAEFYAHPDITGKLAGIMAEGGKLAKMIAEHDRNTAEICAQWDELSAQLVKVLGTDAALAPWGKLAGATGIFSFAARKPEAWKNPFKLNMGELKKRADKARRKDAGITLLK